jgi:SAM-dependent methyltransferase
MRGLTRGFEAPRPAFSGVWCCPYCGAPLEEEAHGLFCAAEGRWFATNQGIHRLLSEERRRELLPFLELNQRIRRDEGWGVEPGLPEVAEDHPRAALWRERRARFQEGIERASVHLPPPPWRVLEVGAGCCWASIFLAKRGHLALAVDVNLDPKDGLPAAAELLSPGVCLPRAEAEMESLPLEPGLFDLVLAVGSLHTVSGLARTLIELRRVTRRGGALLVLESPVYRRRQDGEAAVAARMREQTDRYGFDVPRESQHGYLVLGELEGVLRAAGWDLEIRGWPRRAREWLVDARDRVRSGACRPRFPILLARREG